MNGTEVDQGYASFSQLECSHKEAYPNHARISDKQPAEHLCSKPIETYNSTQCKSAIIDQRYVQN